MEFWNRIVNKVQAQTGSDITATPGLLAVCAVGVAVLIVWQIRSPGLSSLAKTTVRRNRLGLFFPVLQIIFWLAFISLVQVLINKIIPQEQAAARQYARYLSFMGVEVALIAFLLSVAWLAFARGLKGLGLNARTIPKDLFWAAVNLLATYPLMLAVLWATVRAGKAMFGPDFSIQNHQSLEELAGCNDAVLKILIIFFAVAVVPFFEELLFRGMLQSAIAGYIEKPWASIALTSVLFAAMHPQTHAAALFVLSIFLGYAYEKSGSLFRPVFIHIFFNAASVAALLIGK